MLESPDISIVGVGEGTFPTIRTTLQFLGIDEGRFIRETAATLKTCGAVPSAVAACIARFVMVFPITIPRTARNAVGSSSRSFGFSARMSRSHFITASFWFVAIALLRQLIAAIARSRARSSRVHPG